MVKIKGLDFNVVFNNAVFFEDDGLETRTIHKSNLIEAKRKAGRPKDLDELENIE